MLRTLAASFLLAACSPLISTAQTADPFDVLFGTEAERLDTSAQARPGRDDIDIVRIQLSGFTLIDSQMAYRTTEGLCLPVEPLFKALEVPVELSETGAEGWYIHPERRFSLDFETGTGALKNQQLNLHPQITDSGWCLPLENWSDVFPIGFEYRADSLQVTLTPLEVLPLEARLERKALRERLKHTNKDGPEYPKHVDPYQWLSAPVADVNINVAANQKGQWESSTNVALAGDVLKMTGRVQLRDTGTPLITLGKVSEAADQLGPLKARTFALGDVASAPLPMLSKGQIGRGLVLSNRPNVTADVFDTTEIRGPLPIGWEAELYQGEQLLGFVTEPDAKGDYVFPEVSLSPGYNRLTVKLFGPYGETEERQVKIIVGAELCPENELQYRLGIIDPTQEDRQDGETQTAASAYASLRYGLSDRATTQLDAIVTPETGKISATASLSANAFDSYGVMRVATDGEGQPALSAAYLKRFEKSRTRVQAKVRDFGDLENEISGFGLQRTQRSATLSVETAVDLGIGTRTNSMRTNMAWKQLVDGSEQTQLSTRLTGAVGATNWAHGVQYTQRTGGDDGAASSSSVTGNILASRSFKDVRLRGALTYTAQERFALQTLSIAAQKRFGRKGFGQIAISHDMASSDVNVSASLSKAFEKFTLSASARASDKGEFSAGVNLSFALYKDRLRGRYSMAPPGLSRSGAVQAMIYDDQDEDGQLGKHDTPIENAGFIVAQTLRSETSDASGRVIFGDLQPGAPANLELKLSTLEDPFLRPVRNGVTVTPRAGRITQIEVPLTATADLDGTVSILKGDVKTAVSGVIVEAVDLDGRLLGTTKTEYDGYFYLDNIPAQPLRLQISEAALAEVNAEMPPIDVVLSRETPSLSGLELDIVRK